MNRHLSNKIFKNIVSTFAVAFFVPIGIFAQNTEDMQNTHDINVNADMRGEQGKHSKNNKQHDGMSVSEEMHSTTTLRTAGHLPSPRQLDAMHREIPEKNMDRPEGTTTSEYMKDRKPQFFMTVHFVTTRLGATIERLYKIIVKLDGRILKTKTAGGDTAVAAGLSIEAKTALAKASADLDHIKSTVSGVASSTLSSLSASSTIAVSIKADGHDAETQIKAAQMAIEKALRSLGEAHLKANIQQ